MKRHAMVTMAILIAAVALTGCKKDKKGDKGKESNDMGVTMDSMGSTGSMGSMDAPRRAAPREAPRRAAVKIPVDPTFAKAVKAAATQCPKMDRLTSCEQFKAVKKLRDEKGKELERLLSVVAIMGGDDVKQANVAARSLSSYYGTAKAMKKLAKEPAKLDKDGLVKAFGCLDKIHPYNSANAIGALGQLAGLYKVTQELLAAAKKAPKNAKYLVRAATKYFMTYGRLAAFPEVKAMAKTPASAAALSAPRSMYKWTEPEYKAICPWAATFLGHEDIHTAAAAGHLMVRCQRLDPSYIDKLIAAGKKRITEKPETWKNPIDFPYRNPCFGGFFGGLKRALTKTAANLKGKKLKQKKGPRETCVKTYDFLVWVTQQKKVSDDMKARAVMWIPYQERTKYALKWLKKLKRSRNKKVREEAKKQIAWLKKNYLKKKK